MTIAPFEQLRPRLGREVFVADGAVVLGDVQIGDDASVWYGAVVRGDVHSVAIGARTNLQDNCTVHVTHQAHDTRVGDDVTVGHGAILHGCHVGHRCLVGMGAVLMDGVRVGDECVVAARALLTPGKVFPPRSLIVGSPARVQGDVSEEEVAWILDSARRYVELARRHALARGGAGG